MPLREHIPLAPPRSLLYIIGIHRAHPNHGINPPKLTLEPRQRDREGWRMKSL